MAFSLSPQQTGITTGRVVRYMFLPGIFPWMRRFSQHLSDLFSIFTAIFVNARLVDPAHPLAQQSRSGARVSSIQILLLAWERLRFDRRHIPEILLFFGIIASYVLIVALIVVALLYGLNLVGTAQAQYFGMPNTGIAYDHNQDWAFQFLDRIFGGQKQTGMDFWTSTDGVLGNPWLSGLLVGMLKTYSQALAFIGSIMILYLIMVALTDSARSGRPFGEKFDGLWAPIRFFVAIMLLIPVSGSGYNGAQVIVFQVSEWGSNLATNLWHRAILSVDCDAGDPECNFVSMRTGFETDYKFLRDVFLINSCISGYNASLEMGAIKDRFAMMGQIRVASTFVGDAYSFGNKHSADFCGTVILPKALTMDDMVQPYANGNRDFTSYLPARIVSGYREAARRYMMMPASEMMPVTNALAKDAFCTKDKSLMNVECPDKSCNEHIKGWVRGYLDTAYGRSPPPDRDKLFAAYQSEVAAYNNWIMEGLRNDAAHGWAAAGVFYLRLTDALRILEDTVSNKPYVSKLPQNTYRTYATPIAPFLSNQMGQIACSKWLGKNTFCDSMEAFAALSLHLNKSASWFLDTVQQDPQFYAELGGDKFRKSVRLNDSDSNENQTPDDTIGMITGTLLNWFRFSDNDTNPLATVVNWGNVLVNIAYTNYTLGIALSLISKWPGFGFSAAMGDFLVWLGNLFMAPGFILLVVVPFLPFMYFTFAVIEWATSILEAVIGIPLWALTFIRMEGDFIAPAMGGVKMLFEILLRPTIIVMSLLAAILIFTAGVTFMGDAMAKYIGAYQNNHAGNFLMGISMVLVYVLAIYSLATSSFKLIEIIPNNFGRWGGLDGGFGSMVEMGSVSNKTVMASVVMAKQLSSVMSAVPAQAKTSRARAEAIDEETQRIVETDKLRDEINRLRAENARMRALLGGSIAALPERTSNLDSNSPDPAWHGRKPSSESNHEPFRPDSQKNDRFGLTPSGSTGSSMPGGGSGTMPNTRPLQNDRTGGEGRSVGGFDANMSSAWSSSSANAGSPRDMWTDPSPMDKSQAYKILGLDANMTADDLKKAYRTAMKENHPDKLVQKPRKEEEQRWKDEIRKRFGLEEATFDNLKKLGKADREEYDRAKQEHERRLQQLADMANSIGSERAKKIDEAYKHLGGK